MSECKLQAGGGLANRTVGDTEHKAGFPCCGVRCAPPPAPDEDEWQQIRSQGREGR